MRSCRLAWFVFAAVLVPLFGADADEAVARWTLRMGGRVVLQGTPTPISSVSMLPRGSYQLEVVDWVGVNGEPTDLERLSGLKALRELRLPGPLWNRNADTGKDLSRELKALAPVTTLRKLTFSDHFLDKIRFRDAGLEEIQNLTDLEVLAVRQASITGAGLAPFVNLETLDITLCPVTDQGFASVNGMKRLKRLWARDTLITSAALINLEQLTNLEDLDLQGTRIDDEGLAHLAGLKSLRRLNLQSTDITDASVKTLAELRSLEILNLYRTRISNSGAEGLRKLSSLRILDLRYTRASSVVLASLHSTIPDAQILISESARGGSAPPAATTETQLAKWAEANGGRAKLNSGYIVELALPGVSLTPSVIEELSKLTNLVVLDISGSDASDDSLGQLRGLPHLRVLRAGNSYVEGRVFAAWKSPLEELSLTGAPITDEGIASLSKLTSLKRLSLSETDLTDAGLAPLGSLAGLEELDLSGSDAGDKGLSVITKLTNLRVLRLRDTRLTDAATPSISQLTNLEMLDLGRTRVTNTGVSQLSKLGNLRWLVMDYAEVDDDGLSNLKTLAKLETLNLDSTNVTDRSVAVLKSLSNLKSLDLYHSLVTETGFAQLRSALPKCEMRWDKDARVPTRRRA